MKLLKRREPSNTDSVIRQFGNSVISPNSVIRQFGNSVIVPNSVIRQFGNSVIRKTRQGFTIIELLVASLLLGMLMTILTMIFNQSSIAWRTGMAGTMAMDKMRENIAEIREEADNAFVWGDTLYRHTGLWDKSGQLRKRACDFAAGDGGVDEEDKPKYLQNELGDDIKTLKLDKIGLVDVGKGDANGSPKTYTVNVMSAGPNRQFDDFDDIWSVPDDFE